MYCAVCDVIADMRIIIFLLNNILIITISRDRKWQAHQRIVGSQDCQTTAVSVLVLLCLYLVLQNVQTAYGKTDI